MSMIFVTQQRHALYLPIRRHHIFLLTLNDKLYLAPLQNPKRALDVGTGNGVWAQDFADKFPDADIIGTDLAPVQENNGSPNLRFEIDDCCSEWIYPPDHFDYIHIRQLYGSVADWDALYKECYEYVFVALSFPHVKHQRLTQRAFCSHLAPGGYLEQTEICPVLESDDASIPSGSAFDQGGRLVIECGLYNGKTMDVQRHMKDWITKAGFVDVVEQKYKWPLGDWPADARLKDIGKWNATYCDMGIEAWTMRLLTRCHGWTVSQVKEWNEEMRAMIKGRKCHAYHPV
ncbi:MAG: hypothetical protein Q9163_006130 [Psora crenata]